MGGGAQNFSSCSIQESPQYVYPTALLVYRESVSKILCVTGVWIRCSCKSMKYKSILTKTVLSIAEYGSTNLIENGTHENGCSRGFCPYPNV